jgi:hypothetical protein
MIKLAADMGCDLHITRRADCAEAEGPSISLSEWETISNRIPT